MAFYGNWIPARLRGRRTSFKLLSSASERPASAAPTATAGAVAAPAVPLRVVPRGNPAARPAAPHGSAARGSLPPRAPARSQAPVARPPRLRLLGSALPSDVDHAPAPRGPTGVTSITPGAPVSFTAVLDAHSAAAPARPGRATPGGLHAMLHSIQGLLDVTAPTGVPEPPVPLRLRVLPAPSPRDPTPAQVLAGSARTHAPTLRSLGSPRPAFPRLHRPAHGLPMGPDPRHCSDCGATLERRLLKSGEPERLVCTACERVTWPDPKVATGILAMQDNQLVLIRRGNEPGYGKWTFPGGYVDRGERVEDAARREAREEAHLEVENLELVGVYSYSDSPVILVTYSGRVTGGDPRAGDEALEVMTCPLDRIPWDQLAFRSTYDALQDFVRRHGR